MKICDDQTKKLTSGKDGFFWKRMANSVEDLMQERAQ